MYLFNFITSKTVTSRGQSKWDTVLVLRVEDIIKIKNKINSIYSWIYVIYKHENSLICVIEILSDKSMVVYSWINRTVNEHKKRTNKVICVCYLRKKN